MCSDSGVCGPADSGAEAGEVGECVADGMVEDVAELLHDVLEEECR